MIYGNCMLIERMNNPKFKYWAIYGIIIFSVISLAIANYCYNIVEEIGGAYSFFDLLFGALGIIATGVFAVLYGIKFDPKKDLLIYKMNNYKFHVFLLSVIFQRNLS